MSEIIVREVCNLKQVFHERVGFDANGKAISWEWSFDGMATWEPVEHTAFQKFRLYVYRQPWMHPPP